MFFGLLHDWLSKSTTQHIDEIVFIFFQSRFGVCCIFLQSVCGESVQENCTYIRNPGFPEAAEDITTCKFTVQKCDEGML